jgi:murein DD-endopeptidase MepM/ murein hydrolase activator NlpD
LRIDQVVYLPGGSPTPPPTPTPQPSNTWHHPLPGHSVSSNYGWRIHPITRKRHFHYGIDVAAPGGTSIKAAKSGKVVYAGWNNSGYGNLVILDHGDGTRTYYAHLSSITVPYGATVSGGQSIGRVGTTGDSTGNHLHFEVRVAPYRWQTDNRNPRNYIQF